jgi:hypothetical protein
MSRFVLAAAVLMSLCGDVEAASPNVCRNFLAAIAKRAVEEAANSCGFPAADSDPLAQERWCRQFDDGTVIQNSLDRDTRTSRCATCRAYSDAANDAAHKNQMWGCGFTGDRWGTGEGHFQYCMYVLTSEKYQGGDWPFYLTNGDDNARAQQLDPETRARQEGLQFCKTHSLDAGKVSACEAYADKAVQQVEVATGAVQAGRCSIDLGTPEWSSDWDRHFGWCLQSTRAAETGDRNTWQLRLNTVHWRMADQANARQDALRNLCHVVALGRGAPRPSAGFGPGPTDSCWNENGSSSDASEDGFQIVPCRDFSKVADPYE